MSMMIHRAVLRQRAAEEKAKAEPMPSPAVKEQPKKEETVADVKRPTRKRKS